MIIIHTDGTEEKVSVTTTLNGVKLRAITIESEDYRAFVTDKANLGKSFFTHVVENFLVRLVP